MEWKEVRLESILALPSRNGLTKPSKIRGKGVKMIGMGELFANPIIYDIPMDRVPVTDKELFNSRIMPGDLLFARQSLTLEGAGKCCYVKEVKEETVFESHLIRIRIDKTKADAEFIYYFFNSFIGKCLIQNLVTQVAAAGIRGSELVKLEITIPKELEDQRRIASILSSLDRKIELNNKINADLEEMAQAIFKNWFVDFEPFKDGKFVDSELGMIPEGWKVSQIADIPHILENGKRPKGGAVEKGIPSVGAEHVKGMCTYDYSKTKYINCEFAAKLKTGKINGYELMIYKDGGKPGYFIPNFSIFGEGYPFENCYLNEHVFKLDFDGNKEFNIFCYFFFKTEQIMSYFNAQGAKAAIPGINKKDVENINIFSPDNESVIKFGEFAYPLFKQMLKNAIENRTLSLLRDTLLPRLMSGEIEIPE